MGTMHTTRLQVRHPHRQHHEALPEGAGPAQRAAKARKIAPLPVATRYGTTERAFFDGSVMIW
jgi:hypothetical protein